MYTNPRDFLSRTGFTHFEGLCQFHRENCYYKEIATLERTADGFENEYQVERVHQGFKHFAERIGDLYDLYEKEAKIISDIGMQLSPRAILSPPVTLTITEGNTPAWINNFKYPLLLELEKQRRETDDKVGELLVLLPLLFGTGDILESAVIAALEFLGLKTQKAPKGYTADVLAETNDGSRKFGIEVTGINGAIKKESKKLTQVLDFERIKEHDEKTVLIANTHNTTPISQRVGLEDFTKPVLDFLGKHPILLMTSYDLYILVGQVLENQISAEDVIEKLAVTSGKLVVERRDAIA
jgi:hypothetical protein